MVLAVAMQKNVHTTSEENRLITASRQVHQISDVMDDLKKKLKSFENARDVCLVILHNVIQHLKS